MEDQITRRATPTTTGMYAMYAQYIYFFPLLFDCFVFGGLPQIPNTLFAAALLFTQFPTKTLYHIWCLNNTS